MTEPVRPTLPADPAADFERGENGKPKPTFENMRIALAKLGVRLSHDRFADKLYVSGLGPRLDGELSDSAVDRIRVEWGDEFQFRPDARDVRMLLHDAARRNGHHPLLDYLADVEARWDGVERLDRWLTTYCGVADSPYARAVGALTLVGAVRRARQPGCKRDETLVLQGPQGCRKSTAVRILAVKSAWFTDSMCFGLGDQQVIEQTSGKWLCEIPELSGMRRSDVEKLKSFASRQVDRARLAYARYAVDRPRASIFIATTNASRFLADPTGHRRWWPVEVETIDTDALARDLDQLWGEAAAREASAASIQLPQELWAAAGAEQAAREVAPHAWLDFLGDALDEHPVGKIATADLWMLLGKTIDRLSQRDGETLAQCMGQLGWRRVARARFADRVQRRNVWVRGESADGAPELRVEGGKVVVAR